MLNDPKDTSLNALETALLLGRERAPRLIANPLQDGLPFVILRNAAGDERIEPVSPFSAISQPIRIMRKATAVSLDGLLTYWDEHKSAYSSIYFDGKETVQAILDDHHMANPAWCGHTISYKTTPSPELSRWATNNRRAFASTEALAEFFENNVADFVDPAGARMLEIALNFHATSNASYSKVARLSDGSVQLQYTKENSASAGQLAVPTRFTIDIPLHDHADTKYMIKARLRWTLKGSALEIWYELIDLDKIMRAASNALIASIEEITQVKVLRVIV